MRKLLAAALSLGLIGATIPASVRANDDGHKIKHVLLISVDGLHALELRRGTSGLGIS